MRIRGRTLRPSTLAERRIMITVFGSACIKVPRRSNPYQVARRLARVTSDNDTQWVKQAVLSTPDTPTQVEGEASTGNVHPTPRPPRPAPDGDTAGLSRDVTACTG